MKLTKTLALIVAAAFASVQMAASAQQTAASPPAPPASLNAFGIPDNITIFGNDNPNLRTSTAIVNDFVITGTDIDHRLALVLASSRNEVSEEEEDGAHEEVVLDFSEDEAVDHEEVESAHHVRSE